MANARKGQAWSKYRSVLVAMAILVITVAAVLAANFYISLQIDNDAISVNLSGRQRMLSQRIAKSLLEVSQGIEKGQPDAASFEELQKARGLFDTTLKAFLDGGQTLGADLKPVVLEAATDAAARAALERARQTWEHAQESLARIVSATDLASIEPESARAAAEYIRTANQQLLTASNDLTVALERQARQHGRTLGLIQLLGLTIAGCAVLYLFAFSLRNLLRQDRELLEAKTETDNILATVSDGLFLLDRHLTIGAQYSAALKSVLKADQLAGEDFLKLMAATVSENILKVLKDYLALLMEGKVKDKLIAEINPLSQVEVASPQGNGRTEQRYLSFKFKRVEVSSEPGLLVTVVDVTSQVQLAREVDRVKAEREQQMEVLTSMLHVDPAQLRDLIQRVQTGLEEMNQTLTSAAHGRTPPKQALNAISRVAHRIKGDAASLQMESISDWAHRFEEAAEQVRGLSHPSGEDVLSLAVQLKEMFQFVQSIQGMIARLTTVREAIGVAMHSGAENPRPKDPVVQLAADVAHREGKLVEVKRDHWDVDVLDDTQRAAVQSIVNQLVRNAVAHGIEAPQARIAAGKAEVGRIRISLRREEPGLARLVVSDDGAGIDFQAVQARARACGLLGPTAAGDVDRYQLVKLIFQPAFTTRADVGPDAGRGFGLDVVYDMCKQVGGRMKLVTGRRGTEFQIALPAAPLAEMPAALHGASVS